MREFPNQKGDVGELGVASTDFVDRFLDYGYSITAFIGSSDSSNNQFATRCKGDIGKSWSISVMMDTIKDSSSAARSKHGDRRRSSKMFQGLQGCQND